MKLSTITLFLSLSAATTFAAPPTVASIEAILSTNGSQQSLESTLAGVEGRMRQEINRQLFTHNGGPITPTQKLAIDKAAPLVNKVMQEEMGWNKMKQAYTKIYQDALTQEEVNRLAALYKDPSYMALMAKHKSKSNLSRRPHTCHEQNWAWRQPKHPSWEKFSKHAVGHGSRH